MLDKVGMPILVSALGGAGATALVALFGAFGDELVFWTVAGPLLVAFVLGPYAWWQRRRAEQGERECQERRNEQRAREC